MDRARWRAIGGTRSKGTVVIAVGGLHVSYGSEVALAGVDIQVADRELLAVVGSSGSGKSTLLHAIAGLTKPSAGSVVVDGVDVWSMPESRRSAWRLGEVGLVFQFGDLVPELSLADNVALPMVLVGAKRRDVRKQVMDLLSRLGIDDQAESRPGQVSGGQLQRASIARALIHRPKVLLADEPTGALDTTSGLMAMEALTDLAREQEVAVVVVTHDSRIAALCDREVVLRDGRIVKDEKAPVAPVSSTDLTGGLA